MIFCIVVLIAICLFAVWAFAQSAIRARKRRRESADQLRQKTSKETKWCDESYNTMNNVIILRGESFIPSRHASNNPSSRTPNNRPASNDYSYTPFIPDYYSSSTPDSGSSGSDYSGGSFGGGDFGGGGSGGDW